MTMTGHEYYLGSSYYPEQWPVKQWEDDFRKMQDLGFNTVRMGEFAWALFEPAEAEFRFDWMDHAIDLATRHGIRTILCTPTASPPPWLRQRHHAVLGANERGPFDYGGRKGYCLNCREFLDAAWRIVEALGSHFGSRAGVVGWQLDNEPGFPFVCYDENCIVAFRRWLRDRYRTLEALNEAWGTAFWSHVYSDWDQIEFPLNCDGSWNPGEWLDYRRFFADSFMRYLRRQQALLRPHIGDRFVFTNWPNTFWSVDCFKAGEFLDLAAWDNYSATPGITDFREQFTPALHHDMCRCAGRNQRFLVSEQTAQMPPHALQEGVRLQTWSAVAHGACGTIFFEWRPPLGGLEQGYLSVLLPDGSFGPACPPMRKLAQELARLAPMLAGATTPADVAMIFDYENQWQQGFWSGQDGYDAEFDRYYRGLKLLHRNIDVVPPDTDLSPYQLVAAPGLQNVTNELAERLTRYVLAGGTLVLGPKSGTRQQDNRLYPCVAPGLLAEIAGIRVPMSASRRNMAGLPGEGPYGHAGAPQMSARFSGDDREYAPETVMECIDLHGAEAIAAFCGGRMAGRPAVTLNRAGRGFVVYVAMDSRNRAFYDRLGEEIARRFQIPPLLPVPEGVEITSRHCGNRTFYFLLNLTEAPKTIPLPSGRWLDRIREADVRGVLQLGGLDAAVLSNGDRDSADQ